MFQFVRFFLFLLSPEKAHYLTMDLLGFWMSLPLVKSYFKSRLMNSTYHKPIEVAGLNFHNPIGIAAGFDKNAYYFNELHLLGFGFVEIGTVTPQAQEGNPKPRLFRLKKDEALINRMGFNNEGVDAVVERLKKGRFPSLVLGGNIGKNKMTPNENAVDDYVICFEKLHPYVDYFVVNVSSPNTPELRKLQEKKALTKILNALVLRNKKHENPKPIFLKIAPDLSWPQIDEVVEIVEETGIAGLIANNTTLSRSNLSIATTELEKIGAGGLSGPTLKEQSRAVLQRVLDRKKTNFALIASGGISDENEAAFRMKQGADLVQIWTGFIYKGPTLIRKCLQKI